MLAVAVPLAWSPWPYQPLIKPVLTAITTSDQALPVKRLGLVVVDHAFAAALCLLGLWLLWRLAVAKKSSLRWVVAVLAATRIAMLLLLLVSVYITPHPSSAGSVISDVLLYVGWLLPPAATLMALALLAEPYVTARIGWIANVVAWAIALGALFASMISARESAPYWFRIALDVPNEAAIWPVQLASIGTGGLLVTAGVPSTSAASGSLMLWVMGFWYAAARTVLAMIRQRLGLSAEAPNKRFQQARHAARLH